MVFFLHSWGNVFGILRVSARCLSARCLGTGTAVPKRLFTIKRAIQGSWMFWDTSGKRLVLATSVPNVVPKVALVPSPSRSPSSRGLCELRLYQSLLLSPVSILYHPWLGGGRVSEVGYWQQLGTGQPLNIQGRQK